MNVFCCLNENQNIAIGIPSLAEWSIKATPCENGSVLTLQLGGSKEIPIADGNPINLAEQVIEIKDFDMVCAEILGPVTYINVTHPTDNINYFKGIKHPRDKEASEEMTDSCVEDITVERKQSLDRDAFYKWGKILTYLEDHFGAATVSAWFDDAMVIEFTTEVLKIEAGSDFRCEIIKRRCLELIQKALTELFNSYAKVEVYASGQYV